MQNTNEGLSIVNQPDSVPVSYLTNLIEVLIENSIDVAPYLETIGITTQQLNKANFILSRQQYQTFVETILHNVDIPALGIKVGQKFTSEDYGILGYSFICSKTLLVALETYFRYQALVGTGTSCEEQFDIEVDKGIISIIRPAADLMQLRYEIELSFSQWSIAARLFSEQGILVQFSHINFSFPAPDDINIYRDFFQCPLNFNQIENQIVFPSSVLQQSPTMANESAEKLFTQQYEVQLQNLSKQGGMVAQIRDLIIKKVGQDLIPEEIAKELGVSYRTLRRRLSEEGSSFKEVCTKIQMEIAVGNLRNTELSIQEIAFISGYADVSTFHRVFKTWHNTTPGEFRESLHNS